MGFMRSVADESPCVGSGEGWVGICGNLSDRLSNPTNTNCLFCNHAEGLKQFISMFANCQRNNLGFFLRRKSSKAIQNDPSFDISLAENQFAKVFVGCQEQGTFVSRQGQHFFIHDPWGHFCHIADIMSVTPQAQDDFVSYTFIGKYFHQTDSEMGYTTSARKASRAKFSAA